MLAPMTKAAIGFRAPIGLEMAVQLSIVTILGWR